MHCCIGWKVVQLYMAPADERRGKNKIEYLANKFCSTLVLVECTQVEMGHSEVHVAPIRPLHLACMHSGYTQTSSQHTYRMHRIFFYPVSVNYENSSSYVS